jgi:Holliday junction resolvase-like predicted endonuclease
MEEYSPRFKLALIYSLKRGVEEAAARFLVPLYRLETIHQSKHELITKLREDPEFKFKWISEIIRFGFDISDVSHALDWKDFEEVTSRIFQELGYEVIRNYRLKRPRREIDVLARKGSMIIAVDCKNWNLQISSAKMKDIVSRHLERTKMLKGKFDDYRVIPIIVTLLPYEEETAEGVWIVPIDNLREYIMLLEP